MLAMKPAGPGTGNRRRMNCEGGGRQTAVVLKIFLESRSDDAVERRRLLREVVELREERVLDPKGWGFSRVQPWAEHGDEA